MNLDNIEPYRELWEALASAHARACLRPNLSSQVITAISHAGGEPLRAITAGMLTLETLHAPVAKARAQYAPGVLYRTLCDMRDPDNRPQPLIAWGYGSSFVKEHPDPVLGDCYQSVLALEDMEPATEPAVQYLRDLPDFVQVWSKKANRPVSLYPNLAHYTAILAELIQWPAGLEFLLIATLRARAWATHLKP